MHPNKYNTPDANLTTLSIHSENRSICRIDHPRILPLLRDATGDVLPDADHADYLPVGIPAGSGIQQDLDTAPSFVMRGDS